MPNKRLSFNLFNEPDNKVQPGDFRRVTEQLVKAIRVKDPGRLIIVDGRNWSRMPITELSGLNVAADIHSYDPIPLTHYKASWANWNKTWPDPTWPLKERNGNIVDRETIRRTLVAPWQELEKKGVGMFVGEWGVHQHTPHKIALAWIATCLDWTSRPAGAGRDGTLWAASASAQRPGGREVRELARPQAGPGDGRGPAGVLKLPTTPGTQVAQPVQLSPSAETSLRLPPGRQEHEACRTHGPDRRAEHASADTAIGVPVGWPAQVARLRRGHVPFRRASGR